MTQKSGVGEPEFHTALFPMPRYVFLLVVFALLPAGNTLAQNHGQPLVRYFSPEEIGSDGRIFSMAQDADGFVYAAIPDDELLLAFDGSNWTSVETPSSPYSLIDDPEGRVWVGLESGIGYIERDLLGRPCFQTYASEDTSTDILAIWVGRYENGVRLGNQYEFVEIDTSGEEPAHRILTAAPDGSVVGFDGDDLLVISNAGTTLSTLGATTEKLVTVSPEFPVEAALSFGSHADELVFVTDEFTSLKIRDGEGYRDFSPEFAALEAGSLNSVYPVGDGLLGCASRDALVLLDEDGEIEFIVDQNSGLPGKGIIGFGDLRNGLSWVATDRGGFATIEFSRNLYVVPFRGDHYPFVFNMVFTEDYVYVAANNGVFSIDTTSLSSDQDSKPVNLELNRIVADKCFSLIKAQGAVVAPTETGIYKVEGESVVKMLDGLFYSAIKLDEKHLLVDSHVSGLQVLEFNASAESLIEVNSFKGSFAGQMRVLDGRRILVADSSNLHQVIDFGDSWANEPDVIEISAVEGLAEAHDFGTVIAAHTADGWRPVTFDDSNLPVLGDPADLHYLNRLQAQYPKLSPTTCDDYGIVMFGEHYLALFPPESDAGSELVPIGEWAAGTEFRRLITWDSERDLLWTMTGTQLVGIDLRNSAAIDWSAPVISGFSRDGVEDADTSVLRLGPLADVRFSFGAPVGARHATPGKFQYRLNGLDDWSEETASSSKVYSRLPGGTYEFQVRAVRADGQPGRTVSFPFVVDKPWYFSSLAIFGYFLAGALVIFAATSLRARQLAAANRRMERLVNERTAEIARTRLEVAEKAAELDHKKRISEAERLASFDTLVAGIAHDFNNLLTVISANNDLVLHKFGSEATRLTESSAVAIDSAAELCRELAAFSDSTPLELKTVSASSLVREIGAMFDDAIDDTIHLETRFFGGQDYFEVDANQLRRAILNLVVNASEVARTRIIVDVRSIQLSADDLDDSRFVGEVPEPGEYISIEVRDDGPGVPEEVISRVFDPFFSTKQMGRGLGLAIVMKIVSRHRGLILMKRDDEFTCFQVCIPASPKTGERREAVREFSFDPEAVDIVFVDDDPLVLQSTSALLADLGHRVEAFDSAKSSLEYLEKSRACRLAILDLSMPGVSGVELANQILVMRPEMPILFVSGYTDKKIDPPVIERSNVAFLAKPFSRQQLGEAIQGAIRSAGDAT